jgi:AcrR family transcriptional regulator
MDTDLPRRGRPRSESARRAVLEAVDDMLVEDGYAAMTMRGIAERAGVGRQTIYRWWGTKAEILVEACVVDAAEELQTSPRKDPRKDLIVYLAGLGQFLVRSPAGLAFRALVGEAQHDATVRGLLRDADVLAPSAYAVLARVQGSMPAMPPLELAADQLVGPLLSRVLLGRESLPAKDIAAHIDCLIAAWRR